MHSAFCHRFALIVRYFERVNDWSSSENIAEEDHTSPCLYSFLNVSTGFEYAALSVS
jgi:hypothetical protein